jgi:hypothetical protein
MLGRKSVFIVGLLALALAACATQGAMTVNSGAITNPVAKYKDAMAVRTVTGGQAMNILTMPGVSNEPLKAALESSLAANGYSARSGPPKFQIDAEIQNLDQPLIGLDMDVTAAVTYKVSSATTSVVYPISAKATATFSDSPIAADRLRVANERAMQENIKQFLLALR